jgi:hypothetical protein
MTLNLRKYDEARDVYVPPEIDTWYQLKFDSKSGYLVIIHYDRNESLVKDNKENYHEIRRVVQRAAKYSKDDEPSTIYQVLNKVLNNYKDLRDSRQSKDFEYERRYKQPKGAKRDLTNVANHLKRTGMPDDFIHYFFHVENGELIVKPVVTLADIGSYKLDIEAMEKYVWSLKQLDDIKNFVSTKTAGWYPNGKPPLFKKYKKRQN